MRSSVNIKGVLPVQVGFNCFLFHKRFMLLMLPLKCLADLNNLLLMYIATVWLVIFVGLIFRGLGSSDDFAGLYFHDVPL